MPKHQLTGKIISNKMQKTVVVETEKMKVHPKYKRRYKYHEKYKAHVEDGDYRIGDTVLIEECVPMSKDKRWRVIKKIVVNPDTENIETEEVAFEEEAVLEEKQEKAETPQETEEKAEKE